MFKVVRTNRQMKSNHYC